MFDYVISTCSTIDINDEFVEENDIHVLNYTFNINGKDYSDDFGKSYPLDKFYEDVSAGAKPTTSQINYVRYYEYFENILKQNLNVLHITMSSGITGSVNNAIMAANDLNEKYQDVKVKVIDSLCICGGNALIVKLAANKKKDGLSFDECASFVEENKLDVHHWFYTMDLTQLIRGGRLSKTAGLIASTLNICPLMNVDLDGKLQPVKKCIGKRKAALEAIKMMSQFALNNKEYDGYVYINHSHSLEEAKTLEKLVLKNFPKVKEISINSIGTVIGSHTGAGTVALFFVGQKRTA